MLKLKRILWIDFVLGFGFGIIGILFFRFLETLLKIPVHIIIIISVVTIIYSLLAVYLAQNPTRLKLVKSLIVANWLWTVASVILLFLFFANASVLGKVYLILQIVAVSGLAYFEGVALKQSKVG